MKKVFIPILLSLTFVACNQPKQPNSTTAQVENAAQNSENTQQTSKS